MNMTNFWSIRNRIVADTLGLHHHSSDIPTDDLYRLIEMFIVDHQRTAIAQLHADLLGILMKRPSLAAEVMRGMHQAASHQRIEADTKDAMRIAFEHILIVTPSIDMADEAIIGLAALDNIASIPALTAYLNSVWNQDIKTDRLLELGAQQTLDQLLKTARKKP